MNRTLRKIIMRNKNWKTMCRKRVSKRGLQCLMLIVASICFVSCNLFAKENVPYAIDGQFLTANSIISASVGGCVNGDGNSGANSVGNSWKKSSSSGNGANINQYELAGGLFYFLNKDERAIKSFTIVFFLFDEEGEPVNTTRNSLVFEIEQYVESKDSIDFCLNLDNYINFEPNESWFIDYLYVSKIVYEDGNVWLDPFGLNFF